MSRGSRPRAPLVGTDRWCVGGFAGRRWSPSGSQQTVIPSTRRGSQQVLIANPGDSLRREKPEADLCCWEDRVPSSSELWADLGGFTLPLYIAIPFICL